MRKTAVLRSTAALAAGVLINLMAPAQATTVALGSVSSPVTLPVGNDSIFGPFADTFTFSIGAGKSLAFSSFLTTGLSRRTFVADMQAMLFSGNHLLQSQVAIDRQSPEGFVAQDLSFASAVLGAGDYHFKVSGVATGSFGLPMTAAYGGTVDFAEVTAPVPEPSAIGMMALGLSVGAMAFLSRRRDAPVARLATRA